MALKRVTDRCAELGLFGPAVRAAIDEQVLARHETANFSAIASFLVRDSWIDGRPSILSRVASCFCIPQFPFQCDVSSVFLLHQLLQQSIPNSTSRSLPIAFLDHAAIKPTASPPGRGFFSRYWSLDSRRSTTAFAVKPGAGATNKVNVYLNEVMEGLLAVDESLFFMVEDWLVRLYGLMSNDQAGALVVYTVGASCFPVEISFTLGLIGILDEHSAKGLSTLIKSCGLNGTRPGANAVELTSLLGRGVGSLDLLSEASYRCRSDALKIADLPKEALSRAIGAVLADEIATDKIAADPVTDLSVHWSSRWAWAVNGAHSKLTDFAYPPTIRPEGLSRIHRRAWLESVNENPLPMWNGHTYVSASPKLEAGKTRAIFACDTLSYMRFEHMLKRVERSWRGRRVVLDPGKGGTYRMVRRVAHLREKTGVSMMLDYDDFNSQHSTWAQQEVIRQTAALSSYPSDLTEALVNSFDNSEIYVGGKRIGLARGTLMSGHRGTTYINSVLNAAYLRVVLGLTLYERCSMLHVGDDVFCGVKDYNQAVEVVDLIEASSLRMNPLKQSVGHVSSEFLRVCTKGRDSYGYLARSVASIVNGNWVNDFVLEPHEFLASIMSSVRSVMNRGGSQRVGRLFVPAASRVTGLGKRVLRELFSGGTALGHGPSYGPTSFRRELHVEYQGAPASRPDTRVLPHFSSSDFVSNHASLLERKVLAQAGIDVFSKMVDTSYSKSLRQEGNVRGKLVVKKRVTRCPVGIIDVAAAVRQAPANGGLLLKYPLLVLARDRLPRPVVQALVRGEGGHGRLGMLEWEAWGELQHGVIINGALPYSDAASLGKNCKEDVVFVHHNIYM